MSTEYEQHPHQSDQGFRVDDDENGKVAGKGSSGLIRAGLFGVILFLAVIGMASVINNWFRGAPDTVEELAVVESPAGDQPDMSPYKKLEKSWLDTRALLEIELTNKRKLLSDITNFEKQIEETKQETVRAENAVSVAREAVEKARSDLNVIAEKISDLEDQTPQDAFEQAQLEANEAKADAQAAQQELKRAQAEQKRIAATVAELRRAASAADAAANASRLVVSAADAAKQAVTENQDVMAEADGPALSNLENDFFNDAEQQATNMERSARAARQAVEVAELRLDALKKTENEVQGKSAELSSLEAKTAAELAKIEKEVEAHLLRMQKAQEENDEARAQIEATETLANAKVEGLKLIQRDVAVLEGQLETTRTAVSKADDTLEIIERKFQETEKELKEMHRERAQKNAVTMAKINSDLNDKLRKPLSGTAPDHPIFDRLVFSSAKLFEPGSAVLEESGHEILLKVVPVLEEVTSGLPSGFDWVLRVDGHTDNQPISGTGKFKDNWELSQARALAVVRFLMKSTKLEPHQFSANGYGEFQPLTEDTSIDGLAKNRRIELMLVAH